MSELEKSETWDWDSAEVHPPVEHRRTRIALEFDSADYARISRAARAAGLKTTDYIRQVVLAEISSAVPPRD